jgi:hypothetical protein
MSQANSFVPSNDLETALIQAMHGRLSVREFLRGLLSSRLCVPSSTEVFQDGTGFSPVFFDKAGQQMLAVFTSLERAKVVSDAAKYCLEMDGHELVSRMPGTCGIVVNPRWVAGLEISSDGIADLAKEFRAGVI